jgi:ABC-type transporter lipoprotein component MlaA
MFGRCCCDEPAFAYGRRWRGRHHYGPPFWAARWGWEGGPHFDWPFAGPSKAERKEWLEAFKQHLEERLAEVNEELEKL